MSHDGVQRSVFPVTIKQIGAAAGHTPLVSPACLCAYSCADRPLDNRRQFESCHIPAESPGAACEQQFPTWVFSVPLLSSIRMAVVAAAAISELRKPLYA